MKPDDDDLEQTAAAEDAQGLREDRESRTRGFGLGLLYGLALSGLIWWAAGRGWFKWAPAGHQFAAIVIVLLGTKVLSIATVRLSEPFQRYQGAAVGIATSIPLGVVLFVGICFANFRI